MQAANKVTAEHLKRNAYLYIRQSTLRQVVEHQESTRRQYDLRGRALSLGWREEQIVVIDSDQAQSGASSKQREGFQQLVTDVGMDRSGIVVGLEVSRLARNCSDWQRLIEICALSNTLIMDEDGIYDPCYFNDRLLLGLKGTMSEAELHVMQARLRGGLLNKARRGELKTPLPIGLVYDGDNQVILDPNQQIQEPIWLFFETFRRELSANGVVRVFRRKGIRFPRRPLGAPVEGDLLWGELHLSQALRILRNPRYAGAFFYGRTRNRKKVDGKGMRSRRLPREEWHTLLVGAHPGYISWEEYEENQRRLRDNAQAYGADRRRSPPREGPALLQGLVICSVCGYAMTVHYHRYGTKLVPEYLCQARTSTPSCRAICGTELDRAVGELLVEAVSPMTMEAALVVQQELELRLEEVDRIRRAQVESARYESELARRRYVKVDPDNRLVADSLETEWNQKLLTLAEEEENYKRQSETEQAKLSEEQRAQIRALTADFPKLWHDPKTPNRERKRMVRLLIEDVTLSKGTNLIAQIRFKGGATKTLTLPLPQSKFQQQKTSPEVIEEIDRLLNEHTYRPIAAILNKKGLRSGLGLPFDSKSLSRVCRTYGLKSRYQRLREAGMLTLDEIAKHLDVCKETIRRWQRHALVRAVSYNDLNQCLYEAPSHQPIKSKGIPLAARRPIVEVVDARPQEVQYVT
jgi:DNA invertase Pin-like site-specific DNA recombinase